ncbi:protein SINE2-like isoform X2 [Raphanus sativus]|uniref:Protein SINE2-like isoform X2 n=1 Tax=Raphanus sativus TaxID=3726 RepID=A0A9W3DQI1_RAPSA|nr:protein SINE2-like isoform X2 [Raphanus sativus]
MQTLYMRFSLKFLKQKRLVPSLAATRSLSLFEDLARAERLIKEADPSVKSTHNRSYVNDQEDDEVSGSPLLAYADNNQETGSRNQRNRSSESRTNRPRSSRRNRKKRRSERNRHGFTQDSFTVLLENREQQLRQYSESSSSSPIHDRSGTTTPTEDICEKLKIDLDSVAKVKREESETESRRDSSKKSVLRWGLSFFSVVVAGLVSFMWVHLQDDMMMPPHLVPT